jgi:phosphatidylserine decarboxylase
LFRESFGILIFEFILFVFSVLGLLISHWKGFFVIGGMVLLFTAFTLFFFRDPSRTIPTGEGLVVSPADGKVIHIGEVSNVQFCGGPCRMVAIFLSVWNVHVNRAPIEGRVRFLKYCPGKFYQAFRPEAGDQNEQMWIGIEGKVGKVLVKQIAGILARRIVCHLQQGDKVKLGDRFGLIKFGSRVELYLPLSVQLRISEGDRIYGGKTIIGGEATHVE